MSPALFGTNYVPFVMKTASLLTTALWCFLAFIPLVLEVLLDAAANFYKATTLGEVGHANLWHRLGQTLTKKNWHNPRHPPPARIIARPKLHAGWFQEDVMWRIRIVEIDFRQNSTEAVPLKSSWYNSGSHFYLGALYAQSFPVKLFKEIFWSPRISPEFHMAKEWQLVKSNN